MWMTLYKALPEAKPDDPDADAPPLHCPHPSECLRLPLKEERSFGPARTTRTLLIDRYRRLVAQQCACHGHRHEMKI